MQEQPERILQVTKTREALIDTFQRTFTTEGIDLTKYWENMAYLVLNNEFTVPRLYTWMIIQTIVFVDPDSVQNVPTWLPYFLQHKLRKYRLNHLERFIHPTEEAKQIFQLLHSYFSTMVYCITDDASFIQEFEQYTEIPVKGSDDDKKEMALI